MKAAALLDLGYGMFDQEVRFVDSGRPVGSPTDVGGRGWFGTVQVGCNYQISGNIVIGAFADYEGWQNFPVIR